MGHTGLTDICPYHKTSDSLQVQPEPHEKPRLQGDPVQVCASSKLCVDLSTSLCFFSSASLTTTVCLHSAGRVRNLNQLLGDCHRRGRERILKVKMTLSRIMMSCYRKASMEKLSWRVK